MTVRKTRRNPYRDEDPVFDVPHLVLVEGGDDQALVASIIDGERLEGFHVHNMDGKDDWVRQIPAMFKDPIFRRNVTSLALVADAEPTSESAWNRCVDSLARAKTVHSHLSIPQSVGHVVAGTPSSAILIVPDRHTDGAVEELCLRCTDETRMSRVDGYFAALSADGLDAPRQLSKARLLAYFAGMPEYTKTIGVAVAKGWIDIHSNTFDHIRGVMTAMAEPVR